MEKNLVFICPVTNQNVQHRIEGPSHQDYEAVTCLACDGVHLINLKTGKAVKRER
jgi:RNase P subunit RPR2